MIKCPRCNLPQEGVYRCQYCGYVLSKNKKASTKNIRNRLKDIIEAFNKDHSVTSNKRSKVHSVNKTSKDIKLADKGGTRSGTDRRKYLLWTYFPEKRSGKERRKGIDRRGQESKKRWAERRFSLKHAKPSPRKT